MVLELEGDGGARGPAPARRGSALDQQLDRLKREMTELRQRDLALLHQLWSLHDSIHEYKQLVRSPSWDNGYDGSADEEEGYSRVGGGAHAPLASVSEPLSGSNSSLEFGDV